MNVRLRDPITVRFTSSGLSTYYYYSFGFFWDYILPFPYYKALPFLFDYLPSAYLFSAQLWNISEIIIFPFVVTLVSRPNSLWSPSADQTLLKGEWFRNIITQEGKFWKEIKEAEEFIEEEVRGAVERQEEGWKREGKVLLWKERVYVPDSITLQEEIITKHHDSKLAGHPGYTKTYELITRNYWWPRMLEDIKWYVAGCERCQANKPNQQPKRNNLHPNEVPKGP